MALMINSVSLGDFIVLGLYLGSLVYIIGIIILVFMFKKMLSKVSSSVILLCIIHTILTYFISVFIWLFWPFKIDVMLSIFFIPAIIAEFFTIPVFLWIGKKIFNRVSE